MRMGKIPSESTGPWHEWTEHQGLLGKGLSAPGTPPVFGPFMPGTCNISYSTRTEVKNVGGRKRKRKKKGRE